MSFPTISGASSSSSSILADPELVLAGNKRHHFEGSLDDVDHLSPLSHLSKKETEQAIQLITTLSTYRWKNGQTSSFSPKQLLCSLNEKFGFFIDSFQLVGGGVDTCLDMDCRKDDLLSAGIKEARTFVASPAPKRFGHRPNDLDVRVCLNGEKANSYETPPASQSSPKQVFFSGKNISNATVNIGNLYDDIRRHICDFIASHHQKKPDSYLSNGQNAWENAFQKRGKFSQGNGGSFCLYSLEGHDSLGLDIIITTGLERTCLFGDGALGINLGKVLEGDAPTTLCLETYGTDGWRAFHAKLSSKLDIINPENMSIKAFPIGLTKIVKGFTCDQARAYEELLTRYLFLLETATFPAGKEKSKGELILSHCQEALKDHLKEEPVATLFFITALWCHLERSLDENQFKLLTIALLQTIDCKKLPCNETKALAAFLNNPFCSFETFMHIFSFRLFLNNQGQPGNSTLREVTHLDMPHLQWCVEDRYLPISFDPIRAINHLQLNQNILSKQSPDLITFNPHTLWLPGYEAISVDFHSLREKALELFDSPLTTEIAFEILLVCQKQIPDSENTKLILAHLPRMLKSKGLDILDVLSSVYADSQHYPLLFNEIRIRLNNNTSDLSNNILEVIDATISNPVFSDQGVVLFDYLRKECEDIPLLELSLYKNARSYRLAKKFSQHLELTAKESLDRLTNLLALAKAGGQESELDDVFDSIKTWIFSPVCKQIPVSDQEKRTLWFDCFEYYADKNPYLACDLWLDGETWKIWGNNLHGIRSRASVALLKIFLSFKAVDTNITVKIIDTLLHKPLEQSLKNQIENFFLENQSLATTSGGKRFLSSDSLTFFELVDLEKKLNASTLPNFNSIKSSIGSVLAKASNAETKELLKKVLEKTTAVCDPLSTVPFFLASPILDFCGIDDFSALLEGPLQQILAETNASKIDSFKPVLEKLVSFQLSFSEKMILNDQLWSQTLSIVEFYIEKGPLSKSLMTSLKEVSAVLSERIEQKSSFLFIHSLQVLSKTKIILSYTQEEKKRFIDSIEEVLTKKQIPSTEMHILCREFLKQAKTPSIEEMPEWTTIKTRLISLLIDEGKVTEAFFWIKKNAHGLPSETIKAALTQCIKKASYNEGLETLIALSKASIFPDSVFSEIATTFFLELCCSQEEPQKFLIKTHHFFSNYLDSGLMQKEVVQCIQKSISIPEEHLQAIQLLDLYNIRDINYWIPFLDAPPSAEIFLTKATDACFFLGEPETITSIWYSQVQKLDRINGQLALSFLTRVEFIASFFLMSEKCEFRFPALSKIVSLALPFIQQMQDGKSRNIALKQIDLFFSLYEEQEGSQWKNQWEIIAPLVEEHVKSGDSDCFFRGCELFSEFITQLKSPDIVPQISSLADMITVQLKKKKKQCSEPTQERLIKILQNFENPLFAAHPPPFKLFLAVANIDPEAFAQIGYKCIQAWSINTKNFIVKKSDCQDEELAENDDCSKALWHPYVEAFSEFTNILIKSAENSIEQITNDACQRDAWLRGREHPTEQVINEILLDIQKNRIDLLPFVNLLKIDLIAGKYIVSQIERLYFLYKDVKKSLDYKANSDEESLKLRLEKRRFYQENARSLSKTFQDIHHLISDENREASLKKLSKLLSEWFAENPESFFPMFHLEVELIRINLMLFEKKTNGPLSHGWNLSIFQNTLKSIKGIAQQQAYTALGYISTNLIVLMNTKEGPKPPIEQVLPVLNNFFFHDQLFNYSEEYLQQMLERGKELLNVFFENYTEFSEEQKKIIFRFQLWLFSHSPEEELKNKARILPNNSIQARSITENLIKRLNEVNSNISTIKAINIFAAMHSFLDPSEYKNCVGYIEKAHKSIIKNFDALNIQQKGLLKKGVLPLPTYNQRMTQLNNFLTSYQMKYTSFKNRFVPILEASSSSNRPTIIYLAKGGKSKKRR